MATTDDTQGKRTPEDEGIPALDETPPGVRPSDDDQEIILPADRPLAAHDRLTAAEQRERESVRTRLAREEPDATPETDEERQTAGRFYEETADGVDITREVEATETADRGGLSAEEAAVRVHEPDEVMPDEPSTDQVLGRGAADRGTT